MSKKTSIFVTALLITLAVTVPTILSFAQTGSGSVTVPTNQGMMQAEVNRYRSTAYSYVDIEANAVYPAGYYYDDNLTYCRTRIYKSNTNALPISDTIPLREGRPYTHVYINEGYLNAVYYDICFSGYTDAAAVVDYTYDGK